MEIIDPRDEITSELLQRSVGDETTKAKLDIELELDPKINFAVQQNAVPVIKLFRLTNNTETKLTDLTVKIMLEPEYAPLLEKHIQSIDANSSYTFDELYLELSPQKLATLEERLAGKLHVDVIENEQPILSISKPIELLSFSEWSGVASPPELLAAFIQPNHPEVRKLIKNAKTHLNNISEITAFSGYQSKDIIHVENMAKSIYKTIQDAAITYVNPPASFEEVGQKIRTADRIIEDQMGTCLDLAVLMAAALENVGLNPCIVMIPGHAFAGVWLYDNSCPYPAFEDLLQIRKMSETNQILFFDSSTMVATPRMGFKQAVRTARDYLSAEQTAMIIDVQSARDHRIRPLPMLSNGELTLVKTDANGVSTSSDNVLIEYDEDYENVDSNLTENASDRLNRWKNKLLDMSLRNRLLNFKETQRGSIKLHKQDLSKLEDAISSGKSFTIMSQPNMMDGEHDPRSASIHHQQTGEDALEIFIDRNIQKRRIYSDHSESELRKRGLQLYRKARLSLEESGTNTLYLAIGFVHWKENGRTSKLYKAPIILLPIKIIRKRVKDPFKIMLLDSEPRINETFLKKLEKEHGINDPKLSDLPEDANGLDISRIFMRYRAAVLNLQDWEVREEAHISIFSFTKYLMWLDLEERTKELKENLVVEHLLERADKKYKGEVEFLTAEELETKWDQKDNFCVLDADSSQLAAIYAADHGHSFVMEGPPGTGKSQTITNILAQMIGSGKTVLFVSEKRAALDVVYRRLADVGLKQFCLELHSNKASSKEVIRQLGESLQSQKRISNSKWEEINTQLTEKKEHLNGYTKAAYDPRIFGKSFRDAVVELIDLQDIPKVEIDLGDSESVSEKQYQQLFDCVHSYYISAKALKQEPVDNPWNSVQLAKWNPANSDNLHKSIVKLARPTKKLAESEEAIRKELLLPKKRGSKQELEKLDTLCKLVKDAPGHSASLLNQTEWQTTKKYMGNLQQHGNDFENLRDGLREKYNFEAMHSLQLETLIPKFRHWQKAFFIFAWFMLFSSRSKVKKTLKTGRLSTNTQILADLESCQEAFKEEVWLGEQKDKAPELIGLIWDELETKWDKIDGLSTWAENLRNEIDWWEQTYGENSTDRKNIIVELSGDKHTSRIMNGETGKTLDEYIQDFSTYNTCYETVVSDFNLNKDLAFGDGETPKYLPTVFKRLKLWNSEKHQLESWVRLMEANTQLVNNNIQVLGKQHRNGAFLSEKIESVFKRAFYDWWIQALYKSEKDLADFYSPTYEETIKKFRQLDKNSMNVARDRIKAILSKSNLSYVENAPDSSEMGILLKEINKKGRHFRVRKLFEKLPTLVSELKPCFLMSPLSVAQYLGSNIDKFDLVIFDEASQIPPWDAIGAIGRGDQVIIVGDSKQLPPTSFFQQIENDEDIDDNDEYVEDMESILSECVVSNLPSHWLSWHYRSRHEHLIAFSNRHYYNNKLLTFPSSIEHNPHLGVYWIHVENGYYDHGKTRTNKAEAERVVKEAVDRLQSSNGQVPSIGIVTFSQAQQKAIEDLFEQKRTEFPELDKYFSEEILEPVFVKNLENVQGDERDIIIFSICYGPDKDGKVRMRFGPLNNKGGERRLNVAVTRAKQKLIVCSTLTPDKIDLSRTKSEGVKNLRDFLTYAKGGPSTLPKYDDDKQDKHSESLFINHVCKVVNQLGYQTDTQVGCSGYKVDIAIKDPDTTGAYLLGIQCDGNNYHSSKCSRDRDRLRQHVLKQLGWKLHHIWASDWLKDKAEESNKIIKAVEVAKFADKYAIDNDKAVKRKQDSISYKALQSVGQRVEIASCTKSSEKKCTLLPDQQLYEHAGIPNQTSDFYDLSNTKNIAFRIEKVINKEAPIHKDLLISKIRKAWGFNKAGSRIQKRVIECH